MHQLNRSQSSQNFRNTNQSQFSNFRDQNESQQSQRKKSQANLKFSSTNLQFQEERKKKLSDKLNKRILRSQVINLLDDNLKFRCTKLFQHNQRVKLIQQNQQNIQQKEFDELVQKNQKQKMRFGKFKKEIYEPTNKKGLIKDQNQHPFDEVIENPEKEKDETNRAICKLGKSLSSAQLLEIGENPGYFIVKNNHKERKQLMDIDIWDELGEVKNDQQGMRRYLQTGDSKMRSTADTRFLQTAQSKRLTQPVQIKMQKSSMNDNALRKKETFFKYQTQYLKEESEIRQQRFQKRKAEEVEQYEKKQHDLYTKYQSKMLQAQKIVDKVDQHLKLNQELKREEESKKFDIASANRVVQRENDEIQIMNSQLRSYCLEKQIEENIQKAKHDKIARIQALRKYPINQHQHNQDMEYYGFSQINNSLDEMMNM